MDQYYLGDWSTRKITLGNIGVVSENQIKNDLDTNPQNTNWNISDVMVSEKYIYLIHMNMDYISMYNKNEDGSLGLKVTTRNWYNDDSLIDGISRHSSSVPTGYAIYTKNGKDYLIGLSEDNNNNLYQWEINPTNAQLSNRTIFTNVPATFATYGRGGWNGKDKIYFVDKGPNRLYSFDINTNTWESVVTLNNFDSYVSSSYTGSGLLIDEENDEVYATAGANQSNGFLSAWKLSTGDYIGTITDLTSVTSHINDRRGSFQLNPVNRNVGYYFDGYDNSTIKVLDIVLNNQAIQVSDYLANHYPTISLVETNYPDITFTVDDSDGNITDLKITINDIEVKSYYNFIGEMNYTIDYNNLLVGNNSLKIIVKDDFGSEMIKELNVERLIFNNNVYYLITTLDNKICYLDDINQTIVETEHIVANDSFIESKIAEHSFNSIEEINSMIDDLNILKGYKINLFENAPPYKGSLVFETISDIETIVPKQFIDTTDVKSFKSIEIDNRGIFNVVFSNKVGEWCYFDETKTKVIISELNGEVDLLNAESDVLVNQSNNHTELENLLPEIYSYAKETEQIKFGIILPLDNEIKQIKIISYIEGSYEPLILGQDYTYHIKQNEIDVVLSDAYDSTNKKIRINLMK